MAVARGPFLAAVLLLVSSGLHCASPLPACPEPCTCQRAPLLNCSSSGLSLVPQQIQDSVAELDLSHNLLDSVTLDRPHHNLRNVWLGNNSITRLSLCIERNLGGRYVRGRQLHRLRPWSRGGCVSWAPTLQLLSVERNQLEQLPEGLEGSELLQVLQLSFNRISTLRPGDLSHLRQLKELHLQHNLITSLHPQMFQDLAQLRVLDLSFNMLTSLHPLMYLSLRNIGADIRLDGNRWQCDCSMRNVRRRMAYDSSKGLQAWSLVCASPSILSGRDLLQLEEEDLNCFSTENQLYQDVTVYSGSEILLSCSTQDSIWWTPSGQASMSQPKAGLLINDITERDTGLYVCVSEEHEVVSVFNLQISKIVGARRKTRSLPRSSRQIIPQGTANRIGQEKNQRAVQQSDLNLAVCLSVFITFLIAFILGVLARPCIDIIWRRVTNKRRSPETNSVPSVEQGQYDNEAYSNVDESGTHRERRVTFSNGDRENSNVQYYDTVASGEQENIYDRTMIEREVAEAEDTHTAGDSGSENSLRQSNSEENQKDDRDLPGITDAGHTHNMDFEHIPDPVELKKRRSLSSSSDSSLSDKVFNEDLMNQRYQTKPKSPRLAEDSVQQKADSLTTRKVVVPQISIEGTGIPEFSSEPFASWSPLTKNPNLTGPDPWQENGEQFEYSDSVRSMSPRSSSVFGSFNDSKLIVAPASNKQKRDVLSSSSSSISEDEPTGYTVNQEEADIERNHNRPEVSNVHFQQQIHGVNHAMRPKHSFSSHSSDSGGEDYTVKQKTDKGEGKGKSIGVSDKLSRRIGTGESDTRKKVEPMPRTKFRVPTLGVTSHSKSLDTRAPSTPAAYSSSSSSESEEEFTDLKAKQNTGRVKEGIKINEPKSIPKNKRNLYVNAALPASNSTSSDESTDDTTKHTKKQGQADMDMAGLPITKYKSVSHDAMKPQRSSIDFGHVTPSKRRLDIKASSPPTDSSSNSDSADETMDEKQKQGETHSTRLQFQESPTRNHDPQTQGPVLDLGHTRHVKSGLDIKAPSPASDSSSSSDSEDETTHHTDRSWKVDIAKPASQKSQASHAPDTRWPALDLEHIPHVKSRLDIKAPSPDSDSSSSSESEDETTGHVRKQEKGETHMARFPIKVSQTVSHDPRTQRPVLDLGHTKHVKSGLDIKAPSPDSDSSSSSDSEDETTSHIEKKRPSKVDITGLPFQKPQTASHDPGTRWPALDLEHIPRIKRRLDIKAPSHDSDSSSSSGSEDETTDHLRKQEKGETHMARFPIKVSQTVNHDPQTQRPVLDLGHTTHVKSGLDIKAPSSASDSSSSSDSEDERAHQADKPGKMHIGAVAFQKSQKASHNPDTRWPALDLEQNMHIKRRLDIKASSPASDSSSSSDSEDETTSHIEKQRPGKVDTAGFPFQESQTQSQDPDTRWPALDLRHIPRIKRRLDIKAPSHDSDSSSSSDSEDETTGHRRKQEKGETHMARFPSKVSQTVSHEPQTQRPLLDLGHTTHVKSGLDIKAPSSGSDSSSSSDSEDERAQQADKPKKMHIGAVAFQKSQKASHSPDTRWPALDLEQNMHIKRRLDIKASSPASDSSSSSDSEDETMQYTGKPQKVNIAKLASQKSQKASHNPDTRWPALDLEHIPHVKRRLDIKAPSPDSDSSSSSDSEDETTSHIEKQRPGMVDITGLPFQKSQTASHDPDTRWPALDLEHIPHVKSRLDIKAPSPASDSSSSSNSEDETTGHLRKQEKGETHMARFPSKVSQTVSHEPQTQRPLLDLGHTTHVKSGLDIKAPSSASDSSSSSDSEDERAHQADKPKKMHIGAIASQKSQTASHNPDTRWPVLDLEQNMHIKRRLDIKASSQASDSSSSSESEDETMQYTGNPQKVDIAKLASQKSQKASHNPDTRWPALDLEHIPHIKSRLDIKAPSPASDSSSSSNSEDETTRHLRKQEKGETHMARFPSKVSQTVSHEPQTQRPLLDLGHTTHVKSGLDIKAPSSASDSSSSSDSEDERAHQADKPKKMHIGAIASQKSQTASHNPDTRWPVLDLEQNMHIKRRLDIKASSQASDSSSSSDSEDETMQYTGNPQKVDIAKLASQKSQKASHNPDTRWPALDLEHIPHIKRRLDIKAPSPDSDSSSSSDSEDETTSHIEKQRPGKVDTAGFPFQESQTQSQDPDTRWPALDLRHIPRIKRRLDIKAPSHDSDSSSSSDSEDETTGHLRKQEKGETHMARFPSKVSQTVSHEPQTQRSIQDTYIKRGLDIKAPSPASDSSSSSDSEDETTHHKEKEKPELVVIAGVPFKWKSPTVIHSPETGWPAVDLGNITRIKRRLDLKAPPPPPPPDSLLSGGSRKQTVEGNREEAIKIRHYSSSSSDEQDLSNPPTVEQDPDSTWPQLGLSSASSVKRHLDIRAHSPPPESSVVGNTSYQLGTRLHVLDMSIPLVKRRLDIKAPLQQVDSSSSNSDNESRLSSHTGKHERDKDDVGITNDEQQTKLHKLSLGVPSIKRRLDIKAPSPQPDQILISVSPGSRQSESNSSSSNSEDENRDHAMVGLGASAISKAKKKESIRSPKTPVIHTSRSPKTDDNIKLEKYTISTGDREDKTTSDNINTPPEINPELKSRWATMNLNISRFRKRLEITSHTREPPNLPSSPPPDSPSSLSSEKWTGSKSSRTRQNRRGVGMQGIIHTDASPTPEEVKESLIKDYNFPKTEENADSMLTGFGTQHLRGYDVKVSEKAPATPPVQGLSDSSSSSENEDASTEHAGKGWWGRSQLPIVTDKEASQIHTSLYVPPAVNIKLDKSQNQTEEMEKKAGVELKSQTSKVGEEPDSVQSRLSLNNIPHIRGGLDIRAPLQREESSSSNSENETIDHQGPSNSSSSCSENENEVTGYTEKQSRPDSLITYKRLIFKASSPEEEPSHSVGGSNASLAPKTIPSMSLDKVVRKRIEQSRHTTDVELPPEIRWTGIGRQLSDRSISSPRGHLDVGLLTPQQAPPAELLPLDSSNYSSVKSDEKIKQDRGKPMHKYSSLSANSVSLASSRALDEFDNSLGTNEILRAVPMDSRERKGLRALKAMSSERQKWDTQADNLDMGASPLFGDHRPKVDTSFNYQRSEEDIKPVAKQPSLSYDFPHYRRHDIGGIKRPQVPPPPIPATPPPDDAVGLKWRSPQSSMKQGLDATRSYLQQSRNTEEYDPSSTASQNLAEYSDSSNPNISFV